MVLTGTASIARRGRVRRRKRPALTRMRFFASAASAQNDRQETHAEGRFARNDLAKFQRFLNDRQKSHAGDLEEDKRRSARSRRREKTRERARRSWKRSISSQLNIKVK